MKLLEGNKYWRRFEYAGLLAASLVIALLASWTSMGMQIDHDAYDWLFRIHRPADWPAQSVILAIDEPTLQSAGGQSKLRSIIASALEKLRGAGARVVAVDAILADRSEEPVDARLEEAIHKLPNVVLSADLLSDGSGWERPLPRFEKAASGVGHVHADLDDGVSRQILLEKASGRYRLWALALEAYRVGSGGRILESPTDLEVGGVSIPAARTNGRPLRIRFRPPDAAVPKLSVRDLLYGDVPPRVLSGQAVFLGVTAQSATRDRLQTPYSYATGRPAAGVEIHANLFETIASKQFLRTTPAWVSLVLSVALVAAAGLTFSRLAGWPAWLLGGGILVAAHTAPYFAFRQSMVLPFAQTVSSAWLAVVVAASYQYFVVRRRMLRAEVEKLRYQQAMHFVTHEMRTPLTAIQGSSELIGRYKMTDAKRQEMAGLIHSESKRLSKMIEIFLNVERLSAGQMELRQETFPGADLIHDCVGRVRPLADRKRIQINVEALPSDRAMHGDRELLDYAFYNLLTNAVKYSPSDTEVTVYTKHEGSRVRISVRDQGIGMDQKEVRQIFKKFYRTKKAEESGEIGTGIGLSIVEQIMVQHGGSIEVASSPGQGSCFTLVLPVRESVPEAPGKAGLIRG